MDKPNHHENPELWFRPSPAMPLTVLLSLIGKEELTATFRLGQRDGMHPKGYIPGTVATVRLFDENWDEKLCKQARITSVVSKPLRYFSEPDLADTAYYLMESVQQDLSFFEERPVVSDDMVSLIEFSYLNLRE